MPEAAACWWRASYLAQQHVTRTRHARTANRGGRAVQPCPVDAMNCPRPSGSLSGNFVSFGCSRHSEYNDLATLFFNTQDDAIRNLFSTGTTQEYSKEALLVFFLAFYALTIITYGLPLPAGACPAQPCARPSHGC